MKTDYQLKQLLAVAGIGLLCYGGGCLRTSYFAQIQEQTLSSHYESLYQSRLNYEADLRNINIQLAKQMVAIRDFKPVQPTTQAKKFNVSAYTLREQECSRGATDPLYGTTASGARVIEWYTVAASRDIPFGTRLYIPYFKDKPNHGIFVVQDRGGAITKGHLDIYMKDLPAALKFGRQKLDVYVLP